MTSNKTKHSEVQKKLNSLKTNDYNFLLGRTYFTSNDGTLDALEKKKTKVLIMFLVGNQTEYSIQLELE